ncbi:MAG: hypothetical protein LBC37_06895, partial [Zoogloeaceae bacterium]|nr:hypothetical protein [Zoogloeaceae bacterium]
MRIHEHLLVMKGKKRRNAIGAHPVRIKSPICKITIAPAPGFVSGCKKRQKVKGYFLCGFAASGFARPAFGCPAAFGLVPVQSGVEGKAKLRLQPVKTNAKPARSWGSRRGALR